MSSLSLEEVLTVADDVFAFCFGCAPPTPPLPISVIPPAYCLCRFEAGAAVRRVVDSVAALNGFLRWQLRPFRY